MANDKEIIKKLLTIAEKQQKIITKLAQSTVGGGSGSAWVNVSDAVAGLLQTLPGAKGYSVVEVQVAPSTGSLRGKLMHPQGDMKFNDVVNSLKPLLMGTVIKGNDGRDVKVTDNKNDVSFIGMTA